MRNPADQVFEFGNFTLLPKERLLLRNGEPVALAGKALDLLVVLVRRHGHLVSKDVLLSDVWPDTFVQEVNLTVNISALRKALKEGAGGRFIQTVSGHGYRFVAPVSVREALVPPDRWQHNAGNADAYRAYLQGRHELSLRSEERLNRAIERFRCAVQIDPDFAPAYSGLADCFATLGYLSHRAPAESFLAARSNASRALELDASLAEAYASLGFVKLYFDWDWRGAETEFRRAIALDPDYAATHQWYSIYLLAAGRPEEASHEIRLARQRDPLSLPINSDLGFHCYYTGQYEEAVKQLKFVLELNYEFAPAHLWLGRTYQEQGRFDDAIAEFRRVEERLQEWPVAVAARAFVAAIAGRLGEARRILAELKSLANRKFVTSYALALVHAGLGENDEAFDWLNRAFEERSNWLVWMRLDPRWSRLRVDPRFAEFENRVAFPHQD
jgi:DNA-binding winged helix-turn-helix (wHTH) protein/Tfp pilus assembly protein PilF